MQGWIKLYRNLLEKPIWKDSTPEQKTILITLLMMANHKEKEWEWKGKKYVAMPGQFVTSLDSIVKNSGKGISIQNVRTALKRFEKYEFLTNESTNRNRLITIVNWDMYQSKDEELTSELTGNQQATNKQLTTNKNVKNVKNVRTKIISEYTTNENLIQAIKDFKEMRSKIRKPLTDKALKMILNKLDKLANDDETKIAILEQSIMNSWQGVFELRQPISKQPQQKTNKFQNFKPSFDKYSNEELENMLRKKGG